jgi:hypothetical protein
MLGPRRERELRAMSVGISKFVVAVRLGSAVEQMTVEGVNAYEAVARHRSTARVMSRVVLVSFNFYQYTAAGSTAKNELLARWNPGSTQV